MHGQPGLQGSPGPKVIAPAWKTCCTWLETILTCMPPDTQGHRGLPGKPGDQGRLGNWVNKYKMLNCHASIEACISQYDSCSQHEYNWVVLAAPWGVELTLKWQCKSVENTSKKLDWDTNEWKQILKRRLLVIVNTRAPSVVSRRFF